MKTPPFYRRPDPRHPKQAEASSAVPKLCHEHGMGTTNFYKWRAKFSSMDAPLMAHLKELEDENRRLKTIYAEERLKAEIVTEALTKKWWRYLRGVRWRNRSLRSGRP